MSADLCLFPGHINIYQLFIPNIIYHIAHYLLDSAPILPHSRPPNPFLRFPSQSIQLSPMSHLL